MSTDKLQGVLLKLEKGVLGRKWTRKFVSADQRSLQYFASTSPTPEETPRKVFNLDDCSVGVTSLALNRKFKITKEFTFMVEDRASDYTAIFAVESGEERDGWLHYLHNPAPDKRRSHLSMAIEEKLNALNLAPDSKEFALAVFECLAESNNKDQMQSEYLRVLLGHMGKGTSGNVIDALKKKLDPDDNGYISLADFSAWLDADGPAHVPDIAPTRQSVMDFDNHLESKDDYLDTAQHLEGIDEGDESKEVPQQTLDMQAQLAAQAAQQVKQLDVHPEWDEEEEGSTAVVTPANGGGEGDDKDDNGEAPKHGEQPPREEDSSNKTGGQGVDVSFVDGSILQTNASVCPCKGPDMGGQSVVIRVAGLKAHSVSHVTVCGVPATIEKQKGDKLVISTGTPHVATRRHATEDEESANEDIQICTLAGPTFVLQRSYSYLPSIDFFAFVRIEQGLPAQKYGFVMTDFGANTKSVGNYGVSLAFDKAGMSTLKHWHKRWFEVNLGVLTSSRAVSEPSEQVLPISDDLNIGLEPQTRVGRANVLRISSYNKSVLVQAHSEDDQLEWAAVLKQAAFIVTGAKVPEMRTADVCIQAFKTMDSARANGHADLPTMSTFELIAQEYGISRQQKNKKKPPHGVNDKEYQGIFDDMMSDSPQLAQEPSTVEPLDPRAMSNNSRLKVAPKRCAAHTTAPGEASGETHRPGYGYALNTLSPGTSSVDMFMDEIGQGKDVAHNNATYYKSYDDNHAPMIDPELLQFLQSLDIDMTTPMSIVHIFKREQIDFRALRLLTEEEMRGLGIPLGPRKKILEGLKNSRRRRADSLSTRDRTTTQERAAMPPLPVPPTKSQSGYESEGAYYLTPEKHSNSTDKGPLGTDIAHTNSVQKKV